MDGEEELRVKELSSQAKVASSTAVEEPAFCFTPQEFWIRY
jgi:hypothetical protein